ncbi:unnamed protein product [Calypogeia fissa]
MASSKRVLAVAVTLLAIVVVANAGCESGTSFIMCLGYLQGTVAEPPTGCCDAVNADSATCLCQLAVSPPVPVNFNKALGLPKACDRYVPPGTTCDGTSVPGG